MKYYYSFIDVPDFVVAFIFTGLLPPPRKNWSPSACKTNSGKPIGHDEASRSQNSREFLVYLWSELITLSGMDSG